MEHLLTIIQLYVKVSLLIEPLDYQKNVTSMKYSHLKIKIQMLLRIKIDLVLSLSQLSFKHGQKQHVFQL